jgi:hypothetical protein
MHEDGGPKRASSVFGIARSIRGARSEAGDREEEDEVAGRRAKSALGHRAGAMGSAKWEGSSFGEGVLMESNGRGAESISGYTYVVLSSRTVPCWPCSSLVLPAGAYKPSNPLKSTSELNTRILGLPHATMASITLSTSAHRFTSTPAHLRTNLPPPVDFSSHLKPPTKVGNSQLLIQVYAVAVDKTDVKALEDKGRGDVGKWVPGRSFMGRCMAVGADEKDIVRGDLVMGLHDVRKVGSVLIRLGCGVWYEYCTDSL